MLLVMGMASGGAQAEDSNKKKTEEDRPLKLYVRYSPTDPEMKQPWTSMLDLQCEPAGYISRLPEDQWKELAGLGANGLMFYPTIPGDALLDELIKAGYYIYYGSHWVPLHFRALHGIDEGDEKLLDYLRECNRKYPGVVSWGCSSESGIDQPDVRWLIGLPAPGEKISKLDAFERTRNYYLEQAIANTGCKHYFYSQKRLQHPRPLREILFNEWRDAKCPQLEGLKPWGFGNVMEHARQTGAAVNEYNLVIGDGIDSHMLHNFSAFGASRIQSEFNCGCPPGQPTMAFLRGAARAAGIPYFIHWSAWGGHDGGPQRYGKDGKIAIGYTPSLQLREWIFGWLAGAESMTIFEEAGSQAWYHDKDGNRHLSPSAHNLAQLTKLAMHDGLPGLPAAKRVGPYAPFAVMLERHHGYTPGRGYIWWDTVTWTRNEDNIRAFFDAAWPSHEYFYGGAKHWEWEQSAWKDVESFRRLRSEGLETEDYEKGVMGDTRWGDTFDAITEDASPELLAKYKVIILLGGIRLGPELRIRLREYVDAGGVVIVNAPQINRSSEQWLGVELGHIYPGSRNDGLPFDISLKDAEKVNLITPRPIQTPEGHSHPAPLVDPVFLAKASRGKGEVYLTTLDYGKTGAMELYTPFFDELLARFLPIQLENEAKAGTSWMLNRLPKGWLLTVMNHGWNYWECKDFDVWRKGRPSKPWKGTAFFPESEAPSNPTAKDLWTGESLPLTKTDGGWSVEFDVPPYGFIMCALTSRD